MEDLILSIRELLKKGWTNPSAITSVMYYKGFEGRFMEIRKQVEYEFKMYQQEQSKLK